jgi:hypothetical protein
MTALPGNEINVTVTMRDDVIDDVEIASRRQPPIGKMLAGQPVVRLLDVVPRLFALCSSAHAVAAQTAVDAARGRAASPDQERRRLAAVLAERLVELSRGLVVGRGASASPGAVEAVRTIARAAALFSMDGAHEPAAQANAASAISNLACQIDAGSRKAGSSLHRAGQRPLPGCLTPEQDRAVISALEAGGACFAIAPDIDGAVPETGVWARFRESALCAPHDDDNIDGRAAARRREISGLALRLAALASTSALDDCGERTIAAYRLGRGRGAAAVECARGRLFHLVEIDPDDRVARFECLAPTEWNFHPRGPLVQMLRGATVPDRTRLRSMIEETVAAFDPCVGFRVTIREPANA